MMGNGIETNKTLSFKGCNPSLHPLYRECFFLVMSLISDPLDLLNCDLARPQSFSRLQVLKLCKLYESLFGVKEGVPDARAESDISMSVKNTGVVVSMSED